MYKINNISLSDFGIIPNNIGGIFDLPKRIGDCYHTWSESNSVEPFVEADDIVLDCRNITITGTMWCSSESNAVARIEAFKTQLYSKGKHTLSTNYGNYEVYFKDAKVNYWWDGKGSITINFTEIEPPTITATLPTATPNHNGGIDNHSWRSLGVTPLSIKDSFNITGKRELKTSHKQYGGIKESSIELSLYVKGDSVAKFIANIKCLQKLFSSAGLRTVKHNKTLSFSSFCVDGFTVKDVFSNTRMSGVVTVKLIVV